MSRYHPAHSISPISRRVWSQHAASTNTIANTRAHFSSSRSHGDENAGETTRENVPTPWLRSVRALRLCAGTPNLTHKYTQRETSQKGFQHSASALGNATKALRPLFQESVATSVVRRDAPRTGASSRCSNNNKTNGPWCSSGRVAGIFPTVLAPL